MRYRNLPERCHCDGGAMRRRNLPEVRHCQSGEWRALAGAGFEPAPLPTLGRVRERATWPHSPTQRPLGAIL